MSCRAFKQFDVTKCVDHCSSLHKINVVSTCHNTPVTGNAPQISNFIKFDNNEIVEKISDDELSIDDEMVETYPIIEPEDKK